MNGSPGDLAVLVSVPPSGCLCSTTLGVEQPADTAGAQPAAGIPCLRTILQLPTGYTWLKSLATSGIIPRCDLFSKVKDRFPVYKGGSKAIPTYLLVCL